MKRDLGKCLYEQVRTLHYRALLYDYDVVEASVMRGRYHSYIAPFDPMDEYEYLLNRELVLVRRINDET